MKIKTIKLLIAFFAGVILLFLGLIALSYRHSGDAAAPVAGWSEATQFSDQFSARASAQRALAAAAAGGGTRENMPPSYAAGGSTENVKSEGAIMLVKNGEFGGVAEDPQSMMDVLSDMSGSNKKKIPPVYLTDKDLDKKVVVALSEPVHKPLSSRAPGGSASMPGLGEQETGAEAMITAPVDYQLFRSSETWRAFAASHKGHFPAVDFSSEQMLILVSVSDMPSGIFRIAGLKVTKKETVVLYQVNPLAMSADSGAKEINFYAAAAVPKNLDVRLEQVP